METKVWMVEEFDFQGNLVWKMISFFPPDTLEWMTDIRGKKHNLVISELGVINSKKTILLFFSKKCLEIFKTLFLLLKIR